MIPKATAQPNCESITQHCNELLDQANSIIKDQDRIIDLQAEQIDHQKTALQLAIESIETEKERADAWYRQPHYILPIGFILGVGTAILIQQRMR